MTELALALLLCLSRVLIIEALSRQTMKRICRFVNKWLTDLCNRFDCAWKHAATRNQSSHLFCKLEPRHALSVNASFLAGVLDVTVQPGDTTDASLVVDVSNPQNFFVDSNSNGLLDSFELTGQIADLVRIQVNGLGPVPIGRFIWTGDFSHANQLQSVQVSNVEQAVLSPIASIQDRTEVSVGSSVEFGDGSVHQLATNSLDVRIVDDGLIRTNDNSQLIVDRHATFASRNIDLGNASNDTVRFGSLTLDSSGQATVFEDTASSDMAPGMMLTGSNFLNDAEFRSSDGVTIDHSATIIVTSQVMIHADGEVTLQALSQIDATEAQLSIVANSISMDEESTIVGEKLLLESTFGSIELSHITSEPSDGLITIRSEQSIFQSDDGLIRGGIVQLISNQGSIGIIPTDFFCSTPVGLKVDAEQLSLEAKNGDSNVDVMSSNIVSIQSNTAWLQSKGDVDLSSTRLSLSNLAVLADTNQDTIGTIRIGATLTVVGDLRLEGAGIVGPNATIRLSSSSLLVASQHSQSIELRSEHADIAVFGSLQIVTKANIEFVDLNCDNLALHTLTKDGNIDVLASGQVIVSDDVIAGHDGSNASKGSISIVAEALSIADVILTDGGNIQLRSFGDIEFTVGSSLLDGNGLDNTPNVSTISGKIFVIADEGQAKTGTSGTLTMSEAWLILAGRDSTIEYDPGTDGNASSTVFQLGPPNASGVNPAILLSADGDITLASVQSTATGRAIDVSSTNGAIVNAIRVEGIANLVAETPGSEVMLRATRGIGHDFSIQTSVHQISASNMAGTVSSARDAISLVEVAAGDNLVVSTIRNEAGSVSVEVEDGDLIVSGSGQSAWGITALEQGDVTLQAHLGNILLATKIEAKENAIRLIADKAIDETSDLASVESKRLDIRAGSFAHLHQAAADEVQAKVLSNGRLDEVWQTVNSRASQKGAAIADNLSTLRDPNTKEVIFSDPRASIDNPSQYNFESKYDVLGYALYLVNSRNLRVESIEAGGGIDSIAPNVYVETLGPSDLIVDGKVSTSSSTSNEGGIVLVAGNRMVETPKTILETNSISPFGANQIVRQEINTIDSGLLLAASFYNGGEGIEFQDPLQTTTRLVIPPVPAAESAILFDTHIYQRVAIQFGFTGEAGFVAIIGYADGVAQTFDDAGLEGVDQRSLRTGTPIRSHESFGASSNSDAAMFTRRQFSQDEAFEQYAFLREGQEMPTYAIIRRSSDFFLFENAQSNSVSEIVDLTVQEQFISDVFANGGGFTGEFRKDPDSIKPLLVSGYNKSLESGSMVSVKSSDLELKGAMPKTKSVYLYQVDYVDANRNGQPDQEELPAVEDVLNRLPQSRMVEIVVASEGGTPTPADIDNAKALLQSNPQTPTGAYAIVEQDSESVDKVLEIFPIRDFDAQQNDKDVLPIQPVDQPQQDLPMVIPDAPKTSWLKQNELREQQEASPDRLMMESEQSLAVGLFAIWSSNRSSAAKTSRSLSFCRSQRRTRRIHGSREA